MSKVILQEEAADSEISTGTPARKLSVEEEIALLQSEDPAHSASSRARNAKLEHNNLDKFKSESGRMTYYYENVSNMTLAWSHPDKSIPSTPPGHLIDFNKYLDKEDDILSFRAIKQSEFPMNTEPTIRRLTPEEFLEKFKRRRELAQAKNDVLNENRGKDKTSGNEDVSSVVRHKVAEYLTWSKYSEVDRKKSSYTKYDFISWIGNWTFSDPEFKWMSYQVADPEILRVIMERKAEIQKNRA